MLVQTAVCEVCAISAACKAVTDAADRHPCELKLMTFTEAIGAAGLCTTVLLGILSRP